MCFGVDGFFKIPFDDYELSEAICSVSLLFVMFYGGFGTNLKTAKPVMGKAFLLSTAGVVMTAALVGAAAHVLLGVGWMEGILIGSVIASTDAASVFNVLRSKQLSLKYNTDSLLELESGSNDPISYMMTILMISLVSGEQVLVVGLLLKQILIGAACGFLIGKASVFILNQIDFGMKQGRTIFYLQQ
ncbi:cation:proton antiporter [Mediterraneibacter gnavus]|uniref:Cation:proton antiporter n=2 Tax=Mediterraneibacter gnavus TaxID=33038 RepID=A0A9X3KA84_MEDGN|nr:cation:proton antiporter [Mediterraneibacter gnavus]MCZ7694537.1 cation:proton antiporter [Mediterraneibacter gnavus]MCZ7736047.1 cation:proton antiporter [Mediterraneibacter gnavus]MDC6147729.1 cation:proton antiporter [Mediterraneibacter gnavus]MDE1201146.1 cation:proton antiporter [Mediterraneibacter gnavus]